jgi:DNA-binding LacI/PurR family transcriptional regulator
LALTLKRSSVVVQVADALRSEILSGAWPEWIPSERELGQTLHVSRSTCRAGLKILYRERLLIPEMGRGIRVNQTLIRKPHQTAENARSVGIIMPDAVSVLRPLLLLVIDELRRDLFHLGVRLDLHHHAAFYKPKPDQALEKLVKHTVHNCWILILSHHPLQQWFEKRGFPCLTLGSTYPDINLPSVGYDNRAICRHAVGTLIAMGHRRIAFFNRRQGAAGDLHGEAGFFEGVRSSPHPDVDARVVYHDDNQKSVDNLVRKVFAGPRQPTVIFVANAYCYLSVMSTLGGRGLRIPEDVSLIARDDEPFLAYIDPEPARYVYDGRSFARKMMLLIRRFLEGNIPKCEPIWLMARFTAGKSLRKLPQSDSGPST